MTSLEFASKADFNLFPDLSCTKEQLKAGNDTSMEAWPIFGLRPFLSLYYFDHIKNRIKRHLKNFTFSGIVVRARGEKKVILMRTDL